MQGFPDGGAHLDPFAKRDQMAKGTSLILGFESNSSGPNIPKNQTFADVNDTYWTPANGLQNT
jgi:hypothetical protein